jgi:thioredoxin 1
MAGNVLEFTDEGFQKDVIESNKVVVIDFWAPWCGPCKLLAPAIEELANTYAGKAHVGKINIDNHQQHASDFGVGSIPTVMIFKNGAAVEKFVGVTPLKTLVDAVGKHV